MDIWHAITINTAVLCYNNTDLLKNTHKRRPKLAREGEIWLSCVCLKSCLDPTYLFVSIFEIWDYIRPCYQETSLYCQQVSFCTPLVLDVMAIYIRNNNHSPFCIGTNVIYPGIQFSNYCATIITVLHHAEHLVDSPSTPQCIRYNKIKTIPIFMKT